MLSTIIINWNTKNVLYKCLSHLSKEEIDEMIVVDNASKDGSVEMVKRYFNNVKLIVNKKNYGFAKAANIGIKKSTGDTIILLNSDIFIRKGTIKKIKQYMNNYKDIKIAAPLLYNENGSIINSLRPIPNLTFMLLEYSFILKIFPFIEKFLPKYIQGAALIIRKEVIDKVGLFDERFFFYAEDADFFVRIRRKHLKFCIIEAVKATHWEGHSSKKRYRYKYYIKNIEANLKFVDKYYFRVITKQIKNLIQIHFFIKIIFFNIISISFINRTKTNKKISLYKEIISLCKS